MNLRSTLALMICLLLMGCATINENNKIDKIDYTDPRFESGYIGWNRDAGSIAFLEYHALKNTILKESSGVNIKQDGLILNARSILTNSTDLATIFGNEKDSCELLFSVTAENVRNGRSALVSVLNLVSTIQGKTTEKQAEPDTALRTKDSWGTISFHGQSHSFHYKHNYRKRIQHEGMLVLNGDTLTVGPVEYSSLTKTISINMDGDYQHGFELDNNDQTIYAALYLHGSSSMRVFILKELPESEKYIIAAYLYMAACCR